MNKLELLSRLENAVKLFEQKETIVANYKALERKDRPYEEKRKIGLLGKILLGLEMIGMFFYGGMCLLSALFTGDKETFIIGIVLIVIFLAVILTTYLLCILYNRRRNKRVDIENAELKVLKQKIAIKKQELKEQYELVESRLDRYVRSWYPEGYESSKIAAYFYVVIKNGQAYTIGDAITLYQEEQYRRRQQQLQEKIYEEQRKQTMLQKVQVAEQATLIAQLSKTNQQLEEQNRILRNNNKK